VTHDNGDSWELIDIVSEIAKRPGHRVYWNTAMSRLSREGWVYSACTESKLERI
jgi:hypothetical protein